MVRDLIIPTCEYFKDNYKWYDHTGNCHEADSCCTQSTIVTPCKGKICIYKKYEYLLNCLNIIAKRLGQLDECDGEDVDCDDCCVQCNVSKLQDIIYNTKRELSKNG